MRQSAFARRPCAPDRASGSRLSTVADAFFKFSAARFNSIAAARTRKSSEFSAVTNKPFSRLLSVIFPRQLSARAAICSFAP